jgi:hypothetical protein
MKEELLFCSENFGRTGIRNQYTDEVQTNNIDGLLFDVIFRYKQRCCESNLFFSDTGCLRAAVI